MGFTTAKWVMERVSGKEEWREALAEVRGRAANRRKRQRQQRTATTTEPHSTHSALQAEQEEEQRTDYKEKDKAEEDAAASVSHPLATSQPLPLASSPCRPRLLDVGSLNNPYLPYSGLLDLLPIDLNPQHPSVQRMDFFALSPLTHSHSFDVIVLSLVLNFVPSATLRGRMLRRSSRMLRSGGWLYCVLPAACVSNSRWVDESVVRDVWGRCGLRVSEVHYSTKLVLIEATTDGSGEDEGDWKAAAVRQGPQHNNFSIALEAAEIDTGEASGTQLTEDDGEEIEE